MTDESNLPVPADLGEIDSEMAALQTEMADTKGHDPQGYWNSPAKQARYLKLAEAKEGAQTEPGQFTGETSDGLLVVEGVETPTIADARAMVPDLDEGAARTAISTAMAIADLVPLEDRSFFDQSFGGLTDETRAAIVRELASPSPSDAEPASDSVLQTLTERGCGELLREWGPGAARAVGVANARVNNVIDSIDNDEAAEDFVVWFNGLSGGELSAILRMIA